jgi:primosomal protein DnaI
VQSIGKAISHMRLKVSSRLLSLDDLQKEILTDPHIVKFINEHPEIPPTLLERSLVKLDQAIQEQTKCNQCQSLQSCSNLVKGHKAELTWSGAYIETVHTACSKWKQDQDQRHRENLVQSHYIPNDVLQATFQNFVQDTKRFDAFCALMEFCLAVDPGNKEKRMKGVYLYGPLGVGKSHLMAATARKLADRGISSLMVYAPDFFREIKDSFQDHSLQRKVNVLKKVPVLILDDIGAESLSPWARDEVLGAILQYRITENFPTLYTSNYNYELLEEHLAHSAKGGTELLKSKRIMERVIHYTDSYFVDGTNRRVQKQ